MKNGFPAMSEAFKITYQEGINVEKTIRFIDLFADIGGIRKGFELACTDKGFSKAL